MEWNKIKNIKEYIKKHSGKNIRLTRYANAQLINLSTENKDVTFTGTPANSSARRGEYQTRWAYYDEKLENIFVEAVESNRNVAILVKRYRVEYEKDKYSMIDLIVSGNLIQ